MLEKNIKTIYKDNNIMFKQKGNSNKIDVYFKFLDENNFCFIGNCQKDDNILNTLQKSGEIFTRCFNLGKHKGYEKGENDALNKLKNKIRDFLEV